MLHRMGDAIPRHPWSVARKTGRAVVEKQQAGQYGPYGIEGGLSYCSVREAHAFPHASTVRHTGAWQRHTRLNATCLYTWHQQTCDLFLPGLAYKGMKDWLGCRSLQVVLQVVGTIRFPHWWLPYQLPFSPTPPTQGQLRAVPDGSGSRRPRHAAGAGQVRRRGGAAGAGGAGSGAGPGHAGVCFSVCMCIVRVHV